MWEGRRREKTEGRAHELACDLRLGKSMACIEQEEVRELALLMGRRGRGRRRRRRRRTGGRERQ